MLKRILNGKLLFSFNSALAEREEENRKSLEHTVAIVAFHRSSVVADSRIGRLYSAEEFTRDTMEEFHKTSIFFARKKYNSHIRANVNASGVDAFVKNSHVPI